ncbi:MAG: conserved exported protein of unknown function [Nitrosopumilales archaeon]|nr:MAG: conserved exported protein of unknown function [Nitrosopumilales archaeon]
MVSINVLALIVIFGFTSVPYVDAAEEPTRILVSIVGDPIIDLDSTNRLMRASVEVINYNPAATGHYFMQLIQSSTGKILSEKEILITPRDNDLWGSHIAGMLDEDKINQNGKPVLGNYEIKVITELGSYSGSASFTIIKSSESKPPPSTTIQKSSELVEDETTSTETETEIETEIEIESEQDTIVEPQIISNGAVPSIIPDWIKNIALWYGQGNVTEDEFINAIKFLINQGIIEV